MRMQSTMAGGCGSLEVREGVDDVVEDFGRLPDDLPSMSSRLAAAAARRCSGCVKGVDEALEAGCDAKLDGCRYPSRWWT